MPQEVKAKVRQSSATRFALLPGRSGKTFRMVAGLSMFIMLAVGGWAGVSGSDPATAKPVRAPIQQTKTVSGKAIPFELSALGPALRYVVAYHQWQVGRWYEAAAAHEAALKQAAEAQSARQSARHFGGNTSYVSSWVPAADGRIPYDYALWMRVHNCEQGNTWHGAGYFGNGLLSAGTGLGFSVTAWAMAVGAAAERGVQLPASGFNATPDQQMQGAQAFKDKFHGGPNCL